ncbi:MAG TPA: ABC transporter permease subunit [Ktedonobacterales bacterium]
MDGFIIFLRKELSEAARSERLLVVAVVFLLLGIISPLGAKYLPQLLQSLGTGQQGVQIIVATPTVNDAITQFLKNVAGTGILIALLLPMGSVAREKEQGTASFVLTKPLSRQAFLVAKALALFAVLAVGVALGSIAAYLYTALLFKPIAVGGFLACAALILLSLLVYAAFTFLGSTLAQSQLPAVGVGLVAWVAISLVSLSPALSPYTPAGLVTVAGSIALGKETEHLTTSLLANLAIIVVVLAGAWLAFRRQELTARS